MTTRQDTLDPDLEADDPTAEPEAPEATVDDEETLEEAPDETDDADQADEEPNGEAARYRRRLRDTEAERDALAEHLEGTRRSLLEHVVGGKLDLFLRVSGSTLADYFDETGALNAAALETAQDDAYFDLYGKARRPGGTFDETGGWGSADGGAQGPAVNANPGPTWSDALQASRRA